MFCDAERHVKGNLHKVLVFDGVLSDSARRYVESVLSIDFGISVVHGIIEIRKK